MPGAHGGRLHSRSSRETISICSPLPFLSAPPSPARAGLEVEEVEVVEQFYIDMLRSERTKEIIFVRRVSITKHAGHDSNMQFHRASDLHIGMDV